MCFTPPCLLAFLRNDVRPTGEIHACALKLPNAALFHPAAPLEVSISIHKGLDWIWQMWHDWLCKRMFCAACLVARVMFAKDCRSAARACDDAAGDEGGNGIDLCRTDECCE